MTEPAVSPPEASGTGDIGLQMRLADACNGALASTSAADILARLQAKAPELRLSYAMVRAGWHRQGGVVDAQYRRVAEHIGTWAEEQAAGGLDQLVDRCAQIRGFVTKLEGRTHYLTAVTGERAQDFIQIEVEEVQEVIERPLWDPDWLPDDLQEFLDPLDFPHLAPEPVGTPRLLFRRLVRVSDFIDSEDADTRIRRFIGEWNRSSAGESARFSDHWCLSIREYSDTHGTAHLSAKPVPLPSEEMPDLPDEIVARGAALANLIHGFDRHMGYHFAWYFHMLTRRRVSYKLAEAVHADQMGAYDYLPARDLAVLRDWYDAPYSI